MHLSPEAIAGVISHMNEDHSDAVLIYAQVYAGISGAASASMINMTAQYMDISAEDALVRIHFDSPIEDRESSRTKLVELLKLARSEHPPNLKVETLLES